MCVCTCVYLCMCARTWVESHPPQIAGQNLQVSLSAKLAVRDAEGVAAHDLWTSPFCCGIVSKLGIKPTSYFLGFQPQRPGTRRGQPPDSAVCCLRTGHLRTARTKQKTRQTLVSTSDRSTREKRGTSAGGPTSSEWMDRMGSLVEMFEHIPWCPVWRRSFRGS